MNIDICTHGNVHLLGESATRPLEPRWATKGPLRGPCALAALLLLAGMRDEPLRLEQERIAFGRVQQAVRGL